MSRYAQINMETGVVISDSNLTETSAPNLIPIAEDFDLTHKKWDFENKAWVRYDPEPIPNPEPTDAETAQSKLDYLLMMEGSE